jgi:hypothetical protein
MTLDGRCGRLVAEQVDQEADLIITRDDQCLALLDDL